MTSNKKMKASWKKTNKNKNLKYYLRAFEDQHTVEILSLFKHTCTIYKLNLP